MEAIFICSNNGFCNGILYVTDIDLGEYRMDKWFLKQMGKSFWGRDLHRFSCIYVDSSHCEQGAQ